MTSGHLFTRTVRAVFSYGHYTLGLGYIIRGRCDRLVGECVWIRHRYNEKYYAPRVCARAQTTRGTRINRNKKGARAYYTRYIVRRGTSNYTRPSSRLYNRVERYDDHVAIKPDITIILRSSKTPMARPVQLVRVFRQ